MNKGIKIVIVYKAWVCEDTDNEILEDNINRALDIICPDNHLDAVKLLLPPKNELENIIVVDDNEPIHII